MEIQRLIDKKELEQQKIADEISSLNLEKNLICKNIAELEQQAQGAADIFYNEKLKVAKASLANSLEQEEKRYKALVEDYKREYLTVLKDYSKQYTEHSEEYNVLTAKMKELTIKFNNLQSETQAALESKRRAELEAQKQDYYRCVISELDISEINLFREIEPHFRNARPISKVIWEAYYKEACNRLMDHLTAGRTVCGIYKITNLENGKIYIGQALDINSRIISHIRSGVGIDAPNNAMYSDMKKQGVENFMFEVLEECSADALNEKEKFWIDYYKTQSFGYNMTKGGSQKHSI